MNRITAREMTKEDINFVIDYFHNASEAFLLGMGAIKNKLPDKKTWHNQILKEVEKDYTEKQNYYTIWEYNNNPVGHCNINQLVYGKKGFMHLHLWKNPNRQKGLGTQFIKKSLPFFFNNFNLDCLFCEPFSKNKAPNKTLLKVGFDFIKKYETIPGKINFLQEVSQYKLTKSKYYKLN